MVFLIRTCFLTLLSSTSYVTLVHAYLPYPALKKNLASTFRSDHYSVWCSLQCLFVFITQAYRWPQHYHWWPAHVADPFLLWRAAHPEHDVQQDPDRRWTPYLELQQVPWGLLQRGETLFCQALKQYLLWSKQLLQKTNASFRSELYYIKQCYTVYTINWNKLNMIRKVLCRWL